MAPFFSIIIPTLNEELFLPKLLKDLEKQRAKNFEVIIVDSDSEDKTREMANKWKSLLPMNLIANERRNVSYQRNYGAYCAKGKYLVFLDADTRIEPYFTKKLEKAICKRKGLFFVPAFKPDDSSIDIQSISEVINFFIGISQNIGRPFAFGGAMVLERQYFSILGGFNEQITLAEDYDLAKRSYDWGVRAKFLNDVYIIYSLRRIRREGKLQAYYKYLVSNMQYIIQGKVDQDIIKYEMGGHFYNNAEKRNKGLNNIDYLKFLINKAKKSVKKFLQE